MIDVDAFRAAAERQDEASAPPATSFTVTFDEAEAATVRRLAAMAGVSPQLIVQRLATGMPFRSASMNFKDGWIYTCPHTGQPHPADMRDSQTYWCSAVLEFLGLPVVTTGDDVAPVHDRL